MLLQAKFFIIPVSHRTCGYDNKLDLRVERIVGGAHDPLHTPMTRFNTLL